MEWKTSSVGGAYKTGMFMATHKICFLKYYSGIIVYWYEKMYIIKKASDNNVYFHFALKKKYGTEKLLNGWWCLLSEFGP